MKVQTGERMKRSFRRFMRNERMLFCLCCINNSEDILLHPEADVKTGKGQTVDPVRFALVGGTGVMGKNPDGCLLFFLGQPGEKFRREVDL